MSGLMGYLTAFPIATASSAGFYILLLALAVPASRRLLTPYISHPVKPSQQYLLAFDTYRGFAALLVAASHCWYFTTPVFSQTQFVIPWLAVGFKAVPMFAVLSGFLIYRSVLGIDSIQGLRAYTLRRFFRIYPVYAVGVLLGLIFHQYVSAAQYSGNRLFFADLFMFRIFWWPAYANPVTWSLYIEVAFYMTLPFAVFTVGRKHMVLLATLGLVAMLLGDFVGREFGLWKYFLFGIIASEAVNKVKPIAVPLFILGATLIAIDMRGYNMNTDWVGLIGLSMDRSQDGETYGLGLGCAFLLASTPHLLRLSKALNALPFRLLGMISYSVYVIHPFYLLANFPEIGVFSIQRDPTPFQAMPSMVWWYMPVFFLPGILFWGCVSFLLVERPGIRLGKYLVDRARRPEPLAAKREAA